MSVRKNLDDGGRCARIKILPSLVMFELSSNNSLLFKQLLAAILDGACPDFECSLGSPSGTGSSYTALWRAEHVGAVRAWAQSIGLSILSADEAVSSTGALPHIQLPDIGDIAPGGVVPQCLADAERLLSDQGLEPTALNWIAVCDHFLSLPMTTVGRVAAFRLLRKAIERAALGAVRIDPRPTSRKKAAE
jgi:hypothetical protein